jgi:hypothetical protein
MRTLSTTCRRTPCTEMLIWLAAVALLWAVGTSERSQAAEVGVREGRGSNGRQWSLLMYRRLKSRLLVGGVGEQMVMKNPETRTEADRRCAHLRRRDGARGCSYTNNLNCARLIEYSQPERRRRIMSGSRYSGRRGASHDVKRSATRRNLPVWAHVTFTIIEVANHERTRYVHTFAFSVLGVTVHALAPSCAMLLPRSCCF